MPTMRPGRADSTATRSEMNTDSAIEWVTNSDRRRQRLAQPGQQVAHVGAGDLVEGGERLVHQQQRRAEGDGAHEGDALLHAARQLVRVGVGELGQADLVEQLGRRRAVAPVVAPAVDVQQQAGVGLDRAPRQQGRRLGHEADALARPAASCGLAPSTVTVPAVGSTSPPTMRSSVVLPLPDGPSTVTTSPGRDVQVDRRQRLDRAEPLA